MSAAFAGIRPTFSAERRAGSRIELASYCN
jgi:hypothetical protein